MKIFSSERLTVSHIEEKDREHFIELITSAEIIGPIPDKNYGDEINQKLFMQHLENRGEILGEKTWAWGIYLKDDDELIGLCLLLTNATGEREIGYRFRPQFWNRGYGTEVTQTLIDFCFDELNLDSIVAEVSVTNANSIKILQKFMSPAGEYFNEEYNCTNRIYRALNPAGSK